jgi:hypothetical protein
MVPGIEMTMRVFEKTVSGGHDIRLLGLTVSGDGWNTALATAAAQASSRSGSATLGFLDKTRLLATLFATVKTGASLSLRLLPSAGLFTRLLLRAASGKRAETAVFSAASFVPALLTYLANRHRIAIVSDDATRRDALCAHFARHAPWHDVVPLAPAANVSGRLDLVIVDAARQHDQNRIIKALAGLDIGLVVLASNGLSGFIGGHPASTISEPEQAKPIAA